MSQFTSTYTFILPSGVEAEVKELTGKHHRILTTKGGSSLHAKLNTILADVLVRVGSNTSIDAKFVLNMLMNDRKMALVMARQFSMDFDETFKFRYAYTSKVDNKAKEILLSATIPNGIFPMTPMPNQYKEYSEIQRTYTVTLPKSKVDVSFKLFDGNGDMQVASLGNKIHMNSPIELRNPTYKHGDVTLKLNLDEVSMKDISFLREYMTSLEGAVDTNIQITHPEDDSAVVTIDVMHTESFFYPMEEIG